MIPVTFSTKWIHWYLKIYNIYWVRGLQARISTIMNEWCLQWQQVYHFECVESTLLPASRLSTEWSQRYWNSLIMTELDDYRDDYLRLWMSNVFNDNKFTILNVWSKQWYQYQHFWQSEVTHFLKFRILNELEDYMHENLRLLMSGVFNDQRFTGLNEWSQQWSLL